MIEPVVEKPRDLSRALLELEANQASAFVIFNPSRYKLTTDPARSSWAAGLAPELSTPYVWPTLEIRSGVGLSELQAFVATHGSRPLGVSIRDDVISAADLLSATAGSTATFLVHPSALKGGYLGSLPSAQIVELRDSFVPQVRNADYTGEELFTRAHQIHVGQGHAGFADFTVLPGTFNPSGGPLGAAVIHFTFVETSDQSLWVQHFVSDETAQFQSTSTAKLMEAMTKLDAQAVATPSRFEWASPGFASYRAQFLTGRPTSPTYNKRQQIAHHIFTVGAVL
jgi:hypothetical protein